MSWFTSWRKKPMLKKCYIEHVRRFDAGGAILATLTISTVVTEDELEELKRGCSDSRYGSFGWWRK